MRNTVDMDISTEIRLNIKARLMFSQVLYPKSQSNHQLSITCRNTGRTSVFLSKAILLFLSKVKGCTKVHMYLERKVLNGKIWLQGHPVPSVQ